MAPMKQPAVGGSESTRDTLSLLQLARRWGMPRREVRRLLQHGRLPFEEIRGQLRVKLAEVEKFEGHGAAEVRQQDAAPANN